MKNNILGFKNLFKNEIEVNLINTDYKKFLKFIIKYLS